MGKIRRGGFLFVWWIGDHAPRHVHVYRDGKRVCTWNLDAGEVMEGEASRKIRKLIAALVAEGEL